MIEKKLGDNIRTITPDEAELLTQRFVNPSIAENGLVGFEIDKDGNRVDFYATKDEELASSERDINS